ncbi:MAG: peptidoglycan editing factor PgeF [Deltaproteobacteria bacterium]|nr:peptidoglycan editing factor PgeF [Deltaproteobacteria bacterium]
MQREINGNLSLMYFEQLRGCSALAHAVSVRTDPADDGAEFDLGWSPGHDPARVRRRAASVADALGLDGGLVCGCTQVHGSSIACIDEPPPDDPGVPWRMCGECDALVTNLPGITLLVRVADCVPILLYDPVHRVVALVHAGWKGTLAGIAAAAVERMRTRYGCRPFDLLAGVGPSIGPCCCEVGEDVAGRFRSGFEGAGRCMMMNCRAITIDLPEANRLQLLGSGVLPGNIEVAGLCTRCRSDVFFSHRGEQGKTGRFGLFAGLRP